MARAARENWHGKQLPEHLPCGGAKESPSARFDSVLDGGRGETTTTLLAVVMILNTNLIVDGKAAGGEFRAATLTQPRAAGRRLRVVV